MVNGIDDKLIDAKDLRPSTAKKIDSIIDIISEIAKAEYERGKEDEKRWWSGFCAKCTDEDRPLGEWILHFDDIWPEESTIECSVCHEEQPLKIDDNFCPNCGAKMKGTNNE